MNSDTIATGANVLTILALLGNLLFVAFLWRMRGEFVTKAEMTKATDAIKDDLTVVAEKLEETEREVEVIKVQTNGLPKHNDMAEVKETLAKMGGEIQVVGERVNGVIAVVERLEHPLNMLLKNHLERDRK